MSGVDRTTLLALAELCEKAEGADRELDALIAKAAFGRNIGVSKFTTSLDAAMTLVPDGYDWALFRTNGGLTIHAWCGDRTDVFGESPALALTAACLRAIAGGAV